MVQRYAESPIPALRRLAAAGETALAAERRAFAARAPVSDLEAYLAAARPHPGPAYTRLDARHLAAHAALAARAAELAQLASRALIAQRIASFNLDAARCRYPASVAALYPAHLERMLAQLESRPAAFFSLESDGFLKDLGIVEHRLVPACAALVQLGSGIPLAVLRAGGLRQLLAGLRLWFIECGGRRPFFELHTHVLALDSFNPDGWYQCYLRLAELLELNPEVRGWLSASWFLDPKIAAISPRLAYLREVPVAGGATLMFVAHEPSARSGALAKSATRRRLFEQGDYVPATYMRVWPRKSMLRWYARQPRRSADGASESAMPVE